MAERSNNTFSPQPASPSLESSLVLRKFSMNELESNNNNHAGTASAQTAYRYPFIRASPPNLSRVAHYFHSAVESGQYSNFGPVSRTFEIDVAGILLGAPSATACSSATSGLTAALISADARASVAIPAFTFPATLSAVQSAGLNPVLVDVDEFTGVMSCASLEASLARTHCDAVIVVRPYGIWTDISDIADMCQRRGIHLIVDNAAGLGVDLDIVNRFRIRNSIEVFSLHATKPFGVGEGGIIAAPTQIQGRIRTALNFGIDPISHSNSFRGINGKMSELTAAVALAALEGISNRVLIRQTMASGYIARAEAAGYELYCTDFGRSPWQCFPIRISIKIEMDRLISACAARGLQVRRYYRPVLAQYCENSTKLSDTTLCLPIYDDENANRIDEIWSAFSEAINCQ